MKNSIKLLALVLAIVTAAVTCVACNPTSGKMETTSGDDGTVTTTPDTNPGATDSTPSETTTATPETEEKIPSVEITTIPDNTPDPLKIAIKVNGEDMKNFTICSEVIGKTLSDDLAKLLNAKIGSKPTVAATATSKCIKFAVDSSLDNATKVVIDGNVITVSIPKDADTHKVRGIEHLMGLVDFDVDVNLTNATDTKTYTTKAYEDVTPASKILLKGVTDKDPLGYKVGETITFTLTLMNGSENISCPKIAYTISKDNGTSESGWVPCVDGKAVITTKQRGVGMVHVNARVVKANGAELNAVISQFNGGAAANASQITAVLPEPKDFDDFWYDAIDELYMIDPELISMTEITSLSTNAYKVYDVKVKCVDDSAVYTDGKAHDYVSGILTVPTAKKQNGYPIAVNFRGYGVGQGEVTKSSGAITFNVIAHSIEAYESNAYYKALENGDLNRYGFKNNTNKDNIYFKNMILRDLQALRWVTTYFAQGDVKWNGTKVTIQGPSQGGFQAIATTALAPSIGVKVNELVATVPWLCDVSRTYGKRMESVFLPGHTRALDYYDTVNFASRIKSGKVSITVGLSDTTARPTGIIAMYNALGTSNKNMTCVQNGGHDYWAFTDRTTSTLIFGEIPEVK